VLSGRGLCDGLMTRPQESYRLWCVVVCDLETSRMRRPWPTGTGGGGACCAKKKRLHTSPQCQKIEYYLHIIGQGNHITAGHAARVGDKRNA